MIARLDRMVVFTLGVLVLLCPDAAVAVSDQSNTVRFALVGDVCLGSVSALSLSTELKAELRRSDFVFGNLEGPICDANASKRICRGQADTCYFYKMPSSVASVLLDWGFSAFSMANNHVFDYGRECFDETAKHLLATHIQSSGLKGTITSFSHQGIRIAFIAFHTAPWANDIYDLTASMKLIRKAKQEHEIVVISVHAGAEGEKARVTLDAEEFDFGERRGNIKLFAKVAIDAGADLVFGHGPHVLRALEFYHGKPIAYSLGNFATSPGFDLSGHRKSGAIFIVILNWVGKWVEGHFLSTLQDPTRSLVMLDPSRNAVKSLRALSGSDLISVGGKVLRSSTMKK